MRILRRSAAALFVGLLSISGAYAAPDPGQFTTFSAVGLGYPNGISTASFIHVALQTVGQQQFLAYYNDEGWLTIGRRHLGTDAWQVYPTEFTANNLNDGHDVVSFGIDGGGYMHISWGMHNDQYHYSRSVEPVTGPAEIAFGPDGTMTGSESSVTYPQFYNLSGGDLLYVFRIGGSGNGDLHMNRYDLDTEEWTPLHGTPSSRVPIIKGRGVNPSYNAYWQNLAFDSEGHIHMSWSNRYNSSSPTGHSGFQTNHNIYYAWSPDEGETWYRMDGSEYALPITEKGEGAHKSDIVIPIAEGSSLMNQSKMTVDLQDRPVITNWWAPEAPQSHIRQYMLAWYDGQDWRTAPITNHTSDYDANNDGVADQIPESKLYGLNHAMMRPIVVVDPKGRVLVFAMDRLTPPGGITMFWSEDRINWEHAQIAPYEGLLWEPVFDRALWEREQQVHFMFQSRSEGVAPLSVLEWDWTAWDNALQAEQGHHTADVNEDRRIDLTELLRVVQLYNAGGYACADGGDGYAPGEDPGGQDCLRHDGDYAVPDWELTLSELLRVVQLHQLGGYEPCPDGGTVDGYCGISG